MEFLGWTVELIFIHRMSERIIRSIVFMMTIVLVLMMLPSFELFRETVPRRVARFCGIVVLGRLVVA